MTERSPLVIHAERNGSFAELIDLPYTRDEHTDWYEARFVLDPSAPNFVRYSDNHPLKRMRGRTDFRVTKDTVRLRKRLDGSIAEYKRDGGYVVFADHNNRQRQIAHLLYRLLTGTSMPEGYRPDHINHVRGDNRLCNLRCDTQIQGVSRRKMHVDGSMKFSEPGLIERPNGMIEARWQIGSWSNDTNKFVSLGTWPPCDKASAIAAYKMAWAISDQYTTLEEKHAAVKAFAVDCLARAKLARESYKLLLAAISTPIEIGIGHNGGPQLLAAAE